MAIVLSSLAVLAAVFMQPVCNCIVLTTPNHFKVSLPTEDSESKPLLSSPTDASNNTEVPSAGRVGLYGVVGGLKLLVSPQFYCMFFSFSFTVGVSSQIYINGLILTYNNIRLVISSLQLLDPRTRLGKSRNWPHRL